jgi:hypothetical protein
MSTVTSGTSTTLAIDKQIAVYRAVLHDLLPPVTITIFEEMGSATAVHRKLSWTCSHGVKTAAEPSPFFPGQTSAFKKGPLTPDEITKALARFFQMAVDEGIAAGHTPEASWLLCANVDRFEGAGVVQALGVEARPGQGD